MNLPAILAGAAVALILWCVALAGRGDDGRSFHSVLLAALVPALAVGMTHFVQGAGWAIPPGEFMDAALLFGGLAVPLAVAVGFARVRAIRGAAVVIFVVGAAGLFFLHTESLHERYWNGRVFLYVTGLTALAGIALIGRWAAERQGRTTEAALAAGLASLAASPALGWSGTGVTAMDVAGLSSSAGLLGLLLVASTRLRPDDQRPVAPLGTAASMTQTALFAGLLANGVLYAETPRTAGSLLIAAPLIVLLPGRSLLGSLLRLTAVAGVSGYAAFLSRGEPNPYGY